MLPTIAALAFALAAPPDGLANEFCPIMPTEPASPEFRLEFEGRTIGFCCSHCLAQFQAEPERYRSRLPGAVSAAIRLGWRDWAANNFSLLILATENHRWHLVSLLALGLALLVGGRAHRRLARPDPPRYPWLTAALAGLSHPSTLGMLLLVSVCGELYQRNADLRTQVTHAQAQTATAQAGQKLAVEMLAWPWPLGVERVPRGLEATYYRGNDERSPELFNGGYYRTATFRLAVRAAEGRSIRADETLTGSDLFLHVEIERAAGTADGFFTPEAMSKFVFVSHRHHADPVPLTVVEPDRRWEGRLPLGRVEGSRRERELLTGCWSLRMQSARSDPHPVTHFLIFHALALSGGRIDSDSAVWLTPVVLPDLKLIPYRQWFSDDPIPEIVGRSTDDPRLLGLPTPKR